MRVTDKKRQLNNSGFSLVEVLVAIVILAIISLPVLSTFSNAARINSKARRTENANTAINNIVEEAKITPLSDLLKGEGEYTYTEVKIVKTNGADYYNGVNNQKFYIKTTFDKNKYTAKTAGNDNSANDINSYGLSVYTDINSNNNYVYRDDSLDNSAREHFKSLVYGSYDEKQITKKTLIKISLEYLNDDKSAPTYVQKMSVKVTYTYGGGSSSYAPYESETTMRDYTFSAELDEDINPSNNSGKSRYNVDSALENNAKNLYVFYTPFNSSGSPTGTENEQYAKDEIEIRYAMPTYSGDGTKEVVYKDLNVYILQQEKVDSSNSRIVVDGNNKVKLARVYGNSTTLEGVSLADIERYCKGILYY